MRLVLRLLGFLRLFAGQVGLSVLLGTATVASGIGLLGTSAYLIAGAALQPSIAELQVAIVGVRFFGISRGIFRYLERLVSHSINFKLLGRLRVWFYRRLEPLAPAALLYHSSGDLLTRAITDIETLENFYVRAVAPPFVSLLVIAGVSAFVSRYEMILAGLLAGGLLFCALFVPLLTHWLSRAAGQRLVERRAAFKTLAVDGVLGLSDLLANNLGALFLQRAGQMGHEVGRAQIRLAWAGGIANALNLLAVNLTLWLVLLTAIPLVTSEQINGISLAVLSLVVTASFEAVMPLGQAAQHLESSLQAARRLFELADLPPAVRAPERPVEIARPLDIKVSHLTFRYAPDLPLVLSDISFDLPPGYRLAILGTSGAGKSTIINLLLRFFDYEQGKIEVNGIDIRQCDPRQLRQAMALISSSSYLFSGTVRQNLLLARPDAGDGALVEALSRAQLAAWLDALPEGLDTWIGEQGVRISGGERQRLLIARALLQEASLVLLDEPTAHLDAITEAALIETFKQALAEKSILWITHRMAGLDWVDKILVMEAGKIVERGTHGELVGIDGLYSWMWKSQRNLLPLAGNQ